MDRQASKSWLRENPTMASRGESLMIVMIATLQQIKQRTIFNRRLRSDRQRCEPHSGWWKYDIYWQYAGYHILTWCISNRLRSRSATGMLKSRMGSYDARTISNYWFIDAICRRFIEPACRPYIRTIRWRLTTHTWPGYLTLLQAQLCDCSTNAYLYATARPIATTTAVIH